MPGENNSHAQNELGLASEPQISGRSSTSQRDPSSLVNGPQHSSTGYSDLGRREGNLGLRHISLSNPNSVRTSPVNLSMNSMFSPPLPRRGGAKLQAGMASSSAHGARHRSFPNSPMPDSSLSAPYPIPSTSSYAGGTQRYLSGTGSSAYGAPGSYPSHGQGHHWTQPSDPYSSFAGPSSLPSSNYLLSHRAGSLGPAPVSSGSPLVTRRGHSPRDYSGARSSARAPLLRQHRSLESEFPPADPYFHPVGSGIGIEIPSAVSGSYSTHHLSPATTQTYGGGLSYSGGTSIPTTLPLSVSTGSGSYAMGVGPHSNPGAAYGVSAGYPGGHSMAQGMGAQAAPFAPPVVVPTHFARDPYSMPVPVLQREYDMLRREYEAAVQKLNSTMNSIKTFWSPELKKERSLRKEESSKFSLTQEQMKMASQENQKQSAVIRQLQDELQCQYELHRTIRDTDVQTVPKDEYEALRLERDRVHRELQMARDTVRELELQIETQRQTLVSRDDSIKRLLDMLQNKGIIPYNAAQERMELEHSRARNMELETRSRHLESTLHHKDQDIRTLQEECMGASDKLRQLQSQFEQFQRMGGGMEGTGALQSLIETKESRIEQLERQVSMYLEEMSKMRQERLSGPRDFTDKSVSDHDYQEMKLKMEKSEMELSHKQTEMTTLQTRIVASEEQMADLRKHLEVVKEANSAKEQQISLLQGDIEALRTKLENKNETIEQKQTQISQLQQEKNRLSSENADREEQVKIKDGKSSMQQRKIEGLEDVVKEKEHQLSILKERLQNSPAMQQQRQIQDQLDEVMRERERDRRNMREQCERLETQRIEQLESHRREVRDLRMAIESLQKEISDRQVLIESQNEKISDLNRELQSLRLATHSSLAEKAEGPERYEMGRLNTDLDQARGEVDRLLKIVQQLEKDKDGMGHKLKDMQKEIDDSRRMKDSTTTGSTGTTDYGIDPVGTRKIGSSLQRDQRIEELEEALRESVSITAERELAIAQQKQIAQQMEQKVTQYKEQLGQVQRQYEDMNSKVSVLSHDKQDKDSLIRSLKHERRKHLEDVLALKQEALLAAISEKDAHIALIEGSQKHSPEELHTLKKHKEKLMRKLKDENEKRIRLLNEVSKDQEFDFTGSSTLPPKDLKSSTAEQLEQSIRNVELQKKKMRVFIDQLVACVLDVSPDLLTGLPRTQQTQGIDIKLLKKLPHHQLVIELQQREGDSLQLQQYANLLLQRLSHVHPEMVRRALRLLDSLDTSQAIFNYVSTGRESIQNKARRLMPTLGVTVPFQPQKQWFPIKRHKSIDDYPTPLLSLVPPMGHSRKSTRGLVRQSSEGSEPLLRASFHPAERQFHPSYKHRKAVDDFRETNRLRRSGARTPIADRIEPQDVSGSEFEIDRDERGFYRSYGTPYSAHPSAVREDYSDRESLHRSPAPLSREYEIRNHYEKRSQGRQTSDRHSKQHRRPLEEIAEIDQDGHRNPSGHRKPHYVAWEADNQPEQPPPPHHRRRHDDTEHRGKTEPRREYETPPRSRYEGVEEGENLAESRLREQRISSKNGRGDQAVERRNRPDSRVEKERHQLDKQLDSGKGDRGLQSESRRQSVDRTRRPQTPPRTTVQKKSSLVVPPPDRGRGNRSEHVPSPTPSEEPRRSPRQR